jgi:phosphoribosylanthranilate isomerase
MGVLVKICGISDEAGFDAAIDAGADWVGFVFFPPSPRFITPSRAAMLSRRRPGGAARVGLFVAPTEAGVAEVLETVQLDVLQLYARPDHAIALRTRFGRPIWRAIGVRGHADLPREAGGADALLVEPAAPPGSQTPGGNAATFAWSLLRGWQPPAAWLLAGGLTPDNVAAAVQATGARAVDVSSGVERARGVKDPDLIARFVGSARRSEREGVS